MDNYSHSNHEGMKCLQVGVARPLLDKMLPLQETNHSSSNDEGMKCLQDQEVGVARPPSSHENALQPAEGGEGERKGHAAYERAVRQMMGGAPGTAAAAAAVHEGLFADRPAWMSDNPATFTEEQTRQVRAQTASP